MAEIKSTLDLVMEKTKHLKMSDSERKALDVEETLKKVPGLVQKYMDGALKDRDFRNGVVEYCKVDSEAVKKEIVKELARALTFKGKERDLKVVKALQNLELNNAGNLIDELKNCLETFYEEQNKLVDEKTATYLDELEKAGIRGSAVVPKAILRQEDLARLQPIKATCLNLLSRLI